jgi:SDR family mycofactocin-dependent oxidoreductase
MPGRVAGQVAFITGAARGQGRAHAVRLAGEGADIIAVDICRPVETVPYPAATSADLAETARQVEERGQRIITAEVDIRDLAALTEIADRGVSELGRLDIVIANAGISTPTPTLEMSEEIWQTMIDVNLSGQWRTIKATVPHIIAGGRGGAVVLISSLAAVTANANVAHYTAAKAGLIGLMRVLAKELAPERIRVNTVHPTTVATDMIINDVTFRRFRPDLDNPTRADFDEVARTLNALPIAVTEAIDVANAVLYLVSDDGRYVTGSTQMVDAGGSL